jgi:hypothetical protein
LPWSRALRSRGWALGAALGLVGAATDASAEEPRPPPEPRGAEEPLDVLDGSRFLLSVERITGALGWLTRSVTENDFGRFERERVGAQLHLFGASAHAGDGQDSINYSAIPRLALDVVVSHRVTVGGFITVLGSTGTEDLTIDGVDQAEITYPDSVTAFGGARVGYLLPLGAKVAFWPRVGAAYAVQRVFGAAGARQTIQSLQISVEPTFLISPVPHVGILIQPLVDVGVAGSVKSSFVVTGLPTQSSKGSHRVHATGIAAGLVAYF